MAQQQRAANDELKPPEVRRSMIQTVDWPPAAYTWPRCRGSTCSGTSQDNRVGALPGQEHDDTTQGWTLSIWPRVANSLVEELKKVPQFQDVTTDWQSAGLQAKVVVDQAAAARLGLSLSAIDGTLYDAFGQRQVST